MNPSVSGKKLQKIGEQKTKLARKRGVALKNVLAQPFPRYWYIYYAINVCQNLKLKL